MVQEKLEQTAAGPHEEPHDTTSPAYSHYLPLGIDLRGKPCLVIGGGRIGQRKAHALLLHQADVTVVSPDATAAIQQWASQGRLRLLPEAYHRDHLAGAFLVIAATDDKTLNARIGEQAESANLLHCVASAAGRSRVIFPARWDGPDVSIAVHTHGRNCRHASRIRDRLAAFLDGTAAQAEHLTLLGVDRRDTAQGLDPSNVLQTCDIDDGMVLSTCRRWEVYCLPETPRTARRALQATLQKHQAALPPDRIYCRTGLGAFHHLLRIASGLDSPLIGETDIVGQLRDALASARLACQSPLKAIVEQVLKLQRDVRKTSGLSACHADWSDTVVRHIQNHLRTHAARHLTIVGCGKLSRAIVESLQHEDLGITLYSHRAHAITDEWQRAYNLAPQPMNALQQTEARDAAVVLATRVTDEPETLQALAAIARRPASMVIDLDGSHAMLRTATGRYDHVDDLGSMQLSATQAQAATLAETETTRCSLQWWHSQHPQDAPDEPLRIGSRNSLLARRQTTEFLSLLQTLLPAVQTETLNYATPGDRDRTTPLPIVEAEDFFTRDLDNALRSGEIDLAIHSTKDLPAQPSPGLAIAAILPSVARWDALVSRDHLRLDELAAGARVGTSSRRRIDNLTHLRHDLTLCDIRGNVPDRLAQMDAGQYDALVLAVAGLTRLGLADRITEIFPREVFPVTAGQGSLAVLVRSDDLPLRKLLAPLDLAALEDRP